MELISWGLITIAGFSYLSIAMDNDYSQKTTTSIAIVAIVAALALLGIVAITIVFHNKRQRLEDALETTSISKHSTLLMDDASIRHGRG